MPSPLAFLLLASSLAGAADPLADALAREEACFLEPGLAARLAAAWDPVALGHPLEREAWETAARARLHASLPGGDPPSGPGPMPEPETGWALEVARVGGEWFASATGVWLDRGAPEGNVVGLQAGDGRLRLRAATGLCGADGGEVDLTRVGGDRYTGRVCGQARDLVLVPSFRERYDAWARRTAEDIVRQAAARLPGVAWDGGPRLDDVPATCVAAALACDPRRLVAYCGRGSPGESDFWGPGRVVGLVGPDGAWAAFPGQVGFLCAYHRIVGATVEPG